MEYEDTSNEIDEMC